jgi:hypothetical protein
MLNQLKLSTCLSRWMVSIRLALWPRSIYFLLRSCSRDTSTGAKTW